MSNAPSAPVPRQAILEALGSYQKRGRITIEVADMADLLVDESDRGVVVILGSLIEDVLLDRLMQSFVTLEPRQVKNLVRAGGVLSTFDHRINLAHALGVIDDEMVEMLQTVKAMRNACAHSRLDISFKTRELIDALALLFDEETAEAIQESTTEVGLRFMFVVAFVYISTILSGHSVEVATAKGQNLMDRLLIEANVEILKQKALREKRSRRREKRPRSDPTD